ncbi:MAG: quinone-dependent dihydroorotate dehydrogenase, partial [Deltaproteobacteria bacterium]|nr:quinone-dependent dihydroorotate dehydrogenase [Deltaproteobacteria bacterium]
EIGTVTAKPQPGNPRPRLFRLPADRALVNRMGFNNEGAAAAAARLARRRGPTIVGVNIGKSKVTPEAEAATDYAESARLLAPHAAYCVVNVSSPNTPGLRDLQRTEALRPILGRVRDALDAASPARHVPLLVKVAPDLSDEDVDALGDLALELGLDGIVATNTTIRRAPLRSSAAAIERCGAGGLSGPPVKARSLEVLVRLSKKLGARAVLVAAGGIETANDALARLDAGATLLQAYTAFVYEGPLFAARLHRELAPLLAARKSTSNAFGSAS